MDLIINFINLLINKICSFFTYIVGFLPQNPFANLEFTGIEEYLGYLNWIIPVGTISKIITLWLGAIAVYYIYSIALRWVKAIN